MLLDLDMLSASILITYSVQVVLLVRLAERRNFPFSTIKAAKNPEYRSQMKDKGTKNVLFDIRKTTIVKSPSRN